MKDSIVDFFEKMEMYEDLYNGKEYKNKIFTSIVEFFNKKTFVNAEKIYISFFEAYWIGTQEEKNPFLVVIKKMNEYESSGGKIVIKQRDHFIHSIEVFLLGISIFNSNKKMQLKFETFIKNSGYSDYYETKYEEFFYRWGITALFHDVAYPIEILEEQLKMYSKLLDDYSIQDDNLKLTIKFEGMDNFNSLTELKIKDIYREKFEQQNQTLNLKEYTSCIDILAKSIGLRLKMDFTEMLLILNEKIDEMEEGKYIDHGFYSSVIVLKWYHSLIEKTQWNPSYFVYPIVDIATSILFHNMYSRTFLKTVGKMKYEEFPIAFLLILCDELEEWDRINFYSNEIDTKSEVSLDGERVNVVYYSNNEKLKGKCEKINDILDLENLLELNIKIEEKGGNVNNE